MRLDLSTGWESTARIISRWAARLGGAIQEHLRVDSGVEAEDGQFPLVGARVRPA
jgi:hypothetical protein